MDARLIELARARGGLITIEDGARLGLPAGHLSRLARAGHLVALRRGAHVLADVWAAATDLERYALRTRAVLRTRDGVAASHHAALLLAGLGETVPPGALERIDVVSVDSGDGRVRSRRGLSVRPRPLGSSVEIDVQGDPRLDVASALAQVARDDSSLAFAVVLDQALRRGLTTVSEVWSALGRAGLSKRKADQVRSLLLDADPLSPSPAATRLRILLTDMGFQPRRRVPLRDARGGLLVRPELLIGSSVAVVRAAYGSEVVEQLREVGVVVAVVPDADVAHPERAARAVAQAMAELSGLVTRRAS